jgi:hypothetical protein
VPAGHATGAAAQAAADAADEDIAGHALQAADLLKTEAPSGSLSATELSNSCEQQN